MPWSDDVTMTLRSWLTLLSRMRLRTAGVATITSKAATRPPPTRGSSSWCTMAIRVEPADADLLLLLGREDVDDAVDRLGGVVGMERAEDEVTGLGHGERDGDGLEVAHLAHQHESGSSRRALRSAWANDGVSTPTSRCSRPTAC